MSLAINEIKVVIGYTKDEKGEYTVRPDYLDNNDSNLSNVIDAISQNLNTIKEALSIN